MQCQLYLHIRILHTFMYQINLCHTKSYYHAPSIFASRAYTEFITFYRFMCKSLQKCRLQINGPYSIAFITFYRFMCKSLQKCGLQINGHNSTDRTDISDLWNYIHDCTVCEGTDIFVSDFNKFSIVLENTILTLKFSLSVKLFLKKDYKYSAEKCSLRSNFTLLTLSK